MAKTGGLTEMKQKSLMGNSMVTTSGQPEGRSERGQKTQDVFILEQITKPIDFKSKKYITQEYQKTPAYKQYQKEHYQRPEVKARTREYQKEYKAKPEVKEHYKQYMEAYRKEHSEELKEQHKEYYQRPEVVRKVRGRYSSYRELDPEMITKLKERAHKYYAIHKEELKKKNIITSIQKQKNKKRSIKDI